MTPVGSKHPHAFAGPLVLWLFTTLHFTGLEMESQGFWGGTKISAFSMEQSIQIEVLLPGCACSLPALYLQCGLTVN